MATSGRLQEDVCRRRAQEQLGVGTIVTHLQVNWNVRVPLDIIFTPETVIELPPSSRLTVELATTPADSITFGGYIVFEEIG